MKNLASVLFFLLFISIAPATAWERTYGGLGNDVASSVVPTLDSGCVVAGGAAFYRADAPYDVWVFKLDARGDTVWTRTFGGDSIDAANAICRTSDGGYMVAANTRSLGNPAHVWLLKLNSEGDTLWTRRYGATESEVAMNIAATSDAGYVVVGTVSSGPDGYDAWILKVDSRGDSMWTFIYGGTTHEEATSVAATSDGGCVVAGFTQDVGEGAWILKLDSGGVTAWTTTFAGGTNYGAFSVAPLPDNGFIVAGYNSLHGAGNGWVARFDPYGGTLWSSTLSDPRYYMMQLQSVVPTPDGGFVAGGYAMIYSGMTMDINAWVTKLSGAGDTLWSRVFGGDSTDMVKSVAVAADGGTFVAGWTNSFGAGGFDAYVLKLDSRGNSAVESGPQLLQESGHLSASHHTDKLDLRVSLSQGARVRLDLVNLAGETIATILDRAMPSGESRIEVPCPKLAAGVYMLRSDGTLPGARVVIVK